MRPPTAALEQDDAGRIVVVADPWFVQFADLTGCDVGGCPEAAVPEAWELVDLDTGDELPGRFCEEHRLAWLRRPRQVCPAVG